MITFSLNVDNIPSAYINRVWATIQKYKRYFQRYNMNESVDTVMLEALHNALINYNSDYDDKSLDPYIKKLARTVMYNRNSREISYSTIDDETGEVNYVFTREVEEVGFDLEKDVRDKLMDRLSDLYLEYPDTMMELKDYIFGQADAKTKSLKASNKEVYNELMSLSTMLGENGYTLFALLREFYNEVEKQRKKAINLNDIVKEIQIKPIDWGDLCKIPDGDTIVFVGKNNYGIRAGIDKKTLTMNEAINVDLCRWEPITHRVGVVKYDISAIMDYLNENIFVEPGVNTPHISWINNKYKLTSFGGFSQLNGDIDKFLDYCLRELIMSFVHNNINTVIAVSPDYIYVQPARRQGYKTLKCVGYNGKSFNIPIEVYT